ncbi:MAG: glycosyltransferase family 4 protein [Gemmatimonadota bacterium]
MRLLVLNCHEAWVHQLGALDADLDIVVGLPGRYTERWDTAMRPLPPRSRTITLAEAKSLAGGVGWDAVINHNITDLLDTKDIPAPSILVLHETLEGRMAQQNADFDAGEMRDMVRRYCADTGAVSVAITAAKARSWGGAHHIVPNSVDARAYLPWEGTLARGLRVANHITSKKVFLAWDFHREAMEGLPLRIVGHNPDMPGVMAAGDWDDLKSALAVHRFLVHTADPRYEDGYNMAVLEAMAAGMPVITNRHPTTIVRHEETGLVASTPRELRECAERLLADRESARELGRRGQEFVQRFHAPDRFASRFKAVIADARRRFHRNRREVTAE